MGFRGFAKAMAGASLLATLSMIAGPEAGAFRAPELTPEQQRDLKQNFSLSVSKLKGPYTENICVCPGGSKKPIRGANGALGATGDSTTSADGAVTHGAAHLGWDSDNS